MIKLENWYSPPTPGFLKKCGSIHHKNYEDNIWDLNLISFNFETVRYLYYQLSVKGLKGSVINH